MYTHIHTYTHTYIGNWNEDDWFHFFASVTVYVTSSIWTQNMYTDIHTYIYIHTYTHTYRHTYIHTYRHTYRHTDIHNIVYTHTYVCTNNILFSETKPIMCHRHSPVSCMWWDDCSAPYTGCSVLRAPAGSANPVALLRHFQDIELSFFYPKDTTIKRENVKTVDLITFQFPNQP